MKPATSLCSWRSCEGTRRWINESPATAISTDTATTNRPDTMLITANLFSCLSERAERPRIMTSKHNSLTHLYSTRCVLSGSRPHFLDLALRTTQHTVDIE